MSSGANVAIRFDDADKAALREIAERFCGGNQSLVLRTLVREVFQVMKEQDGWKSHKQKLGRKKSHHDKFIGT